MAASQNPFTHTWSLGVEEQFYALYPFIFLVVHNLVKLRRAKTLTLIIGLLTSVSLILYIYFLESKSNFSFYSMPTRSWQIGVGILVFVLATQIFSVKIGSGKWQLLVLIVLGANFFGTGSDLRSQMIVVGCTALLLLRCENGTAIKLLSSPILNWIGVRSYSIYFIHWPILFFTNYLFGLGVIKNLLCIPSIILLSALTYRYIESPFRSGRLAVQSKTALSVGLPCIFCATVAIYVGAPNLSQSYKNSIPKLMNIQDVPIWVPTRCSDAIQIGKSDDPVVKCLGGSRSSSRKFVYVIGDSHAESIVPMVKEVLHPPMFEVRYLSESNEGFPFPEFLPNTNSVSLKFLMMNAKRDDLVILAFHRGHLNASRDLHIPLDQEIGIGSPTRNLIDNLNRFVLHMSQIGVKVILIKDTPLMASVQTSESCALQLKLFGSNGCKVHKDQDSKTRYRQSYSFDEIAKNNPNVLAWDPFNFIYQDSPYFDVVDQKEDYVMWDWNHITQSFSLRLAPIFREDIRGFINY